MLSWKEYTKAIDVWSVGCIFAELLGRRALQNLNPQGAHGPLKCGPRKVQAVRCEWTDRSETEGVVQSVQSSAPRIGLAFVF
jgi:serine/threonine protein kinase